MTWGPDGWLYGRRGAPSRPGSAATSSSRRSGAIIPGPDGSRSSPRGAATPGGSTSTRPATPSAAATARTSRSTWSRAAITSRASPSTARSTTRAPTAISARSTTAGPRYGGHVTPGGIIYKGDAFPPSFRGSFIGGNLLSNAVYWHVLERDGSTFAGRHGGTLIDARDRWFRPIDLLAGPDAAVYVVDWYDKRAAHLDPRDTWDRTNGRIYRVVYGDRRKVAPLRPVETHLRRAGRPADQHQRLVPRRGPAHPGRASGRVGRARAEATAGRRPRRDGRPPRPLGPARQRRARRRRRRWGCSIIRSPASGDGRSGCWATTTG